MNFGGTTVRENPKMNETYPARIVNIVDVGTQDNFDKTKSPVRQILIGVELVGEYRSDGKPFIITAQPAMSNHSNSGLMAWTQSLTGLSFEIGEKAKNGTGFFYRLPENFVDILKGLIGFPCMATIVPNSNGNAKIATLSKPPKGFEVPVPESDMCFFDLDDKDGFDLKYSRLPSWIKNIISKCHEFKVQNPVVANTAKPDFDNTPAVDNQKKQSEEVYKDDIPY